MIRIECNCKHCNGNAALIPDQLHATLAAKPGGWHGIVTLVHGNGPTDAFVAKRMGVVSA